MSETWIQNIFWDVGLPRKGFAEPRWQMPVRWKNRRRHGTLRWHMRPLLLTCAGILLGSVLLRAQANADSGASAPEFAGSVPVFKSSSQLVLVDVLVMDPKSGLPVNTLQRDDFQVSDNGRVVPFAAFDSGARYDTRSIALWFVVICNLPGHGPHSELASGSFAGNESLLRPGLEDMDKRDRVGVAHWCDDGEAKIDLRPTVKQDLAISTLATVLKPVPPDLKIDNRTGELTLQRLVRLIIDDAHEGNPQPLPVVVFLHSDHTGMPIRELNRIVDEFLETSGIAFGIKDHGVDEFIKGMLGNGEQGSVLHYMVEATGGQYYSVPKEMFSLALQSILAQLHFRYELGFKPPSLDGKRHELKVELVGAAKKQYKSVQLRYRPEYIPKPN